MNIDAENNTDIIAPKVRQTQISNETKWLMYLLVLLKYLYKCINETYMFCPFLNLFFFIRRACLMKKIYYLCISRQYKHNFTDVDEVDCNFLLIRHVTNKNWQPDFAKDYNNSILFSSGKEKCFFSSFWLLYLRFL